MSTTIDVQQLTEDRARDSRLLGCAAVLALPASVAVMLLATPDSTSPLAYWAVSSVALATALVVLVAGECAWEGSVARARAAGLVGR